MISCSYDNLFSLTQAGTASTASASTPAATTAKAASAAPAAVADASADATAGEGDLDKRIRAVKKKLRQIAELQVCFCALFILLPELYTLVELNLVIVSFSHPCFDPSVRLTWLASNLNPSLMTTSSHLLHAGASS
jgi:hypothetical protein